MSNVKGEFYPVLCHSAAITMLTKTVRGKGSLVRSQRGTAGSMLKKMSSDSVSLNESSTSQQTFMMGQIVVYYSIAYIFLSCMDVK